MTCKLGITIVDESKDFFVEKSGHSSCRRAKRSWLVDVRREKPVSTRRKLLIEDFATSVYKQPKTYCTKTTTVSSGNIHYAHPRAVIPSFGSNRGHATRKQVQNGFKHECLAAKHLNFERALDKCGHTAHYKE